MLKKTFEQITRRQEILPKHHIDTSIFFESKDKEEMRVCERYLQKVGYNYRGFVSLPVLSEFFIVMLRFNEYNKREEIFKFINHVLEVREISIYYPKDIGNLLTRIKETDKILDDLDIHILASVIQHKADCLVTIDKTILQSEKVRNEFNVKIKHPRELL